MATLADIVNRGPYSQLQANNNRRLAALRAPTAQSAQSYLTDTDPMTGQQWSTDAANQVDPSILAHNPNATPEQMALAAQKFPNGLPSDGTDFSAPGGGSAGIDTTPGRYGLIGDPDYNLPGGAGYTPPPGTPPVVTDPGTPGGGGPATADAGLLGQFGSDGGAYDIQKYLDPSMDFQMQQGLRSLGSSAAAQGQTFSGNNEKNILDYSQGVASKAYSDAATRAMADRQFGYGVARDDQTIPWGQQLDLAKVGLGGAGIDADLKKTLATLLSANTVAGGTAAGSGTIGGNNAITAAITSILNNGASGSTLAAILKQAGIGG